MDVFDPREVRGKMIMMIKIIVIIKVIVRIKMIMIINRKEGK